MVYVTIIELMNQYHGSKNPELREGMTRPHFREPSWIMETSILRIYESVEDVGAQMVPTTKYSKKEGACYKETLGHLHY